MAAGRTLKSLMSRRRRTEDEGEDEDGPMLVGDSQSEGSALSELEDDDEDGSVSGGPSGVEPTLGASAQSEPEGAASESKLKKNRKSRKKGERRVKDGAAEPSQPQSDFKVMADTAAMMNGLHISHQSPGQAEAVDFESMGPTGIAPAPVAAPVAAPNGHVVTAAAKQRQEHEEYKKKRDSDPTFIPNRGNFFMHDTRGQPNGQVPPPRGAWQARGRGRGGTNVGGPFSPANQFAQAERAAEQQWKHDLHEVINQHPTPQAFGSKAEDATQDQKESTRLFPKPATQDPARVRGGDFVKTTLLGKVQIRVLLSGMEEPIVFPDIPWKTYLRLAEPRPSLRRDKPVRILLPGGVQNYRFPKPERSFIFIPRQMRPNQRGSRGGYQRSVGGYGYSSRRTSMYSGSVAASRRSSIAGLPRDNAFSPPGSVVGMPTGRPPVRLPYAQHFSAGTTPLGPLSGHHTPVGMPQIHTYPLPQQPMKEGIPATEVHHPLPQKTISVTGIESPLQQQAANDAQPFQNQLPLHLNEQSAYPPQPQPPPYFSPRQQYPYAQLPPQTGTPLSGIPEQGIHAPPFHPPAYGQPPFYAPYQAQPNFYYQPPAPHGYPGAPIYMPPPHQGYMPPPQPPVMAAPPQPPPQPPSQPSEESHHRPQQSQSGMVAREDRGMVYYVPASEAEESQQYQPAESFVPSWAIPALPPPTPAPDNPMPYYYPQMQPGAMQEMGTAVYYPAQPQQ